VKESPDCSQHEENGERIKKDHDGSGKKGRSAKESQVQSHEVKAATRLGVPKVNKWASWSLFPIFMERRSDLKGDPSTRSRTTAGRKNKKVYVTGPPPSIGVS
jgi:hypothetical protein